jgi:hypothetical protein
MIDNDLYIASRLHVARGIKKVEATSVAPAHEETDVVVIAPGQLVSDTDLTPAEIAQFKRFGVLRYATSEEREVMAAIAANKADTESAADAAADAQLLAQEQKIERDRVAAEQKANADKAAADLVAKQEDDRAVAANTAAKGRK